MDRAVAAGQPRRLVLHETAGNPLDCATHRTDRVVVRPDTGDDASARGAARRDRGLAAWRLAGPDADGTFGDGILGSVVRGRLYPHMGGCLACEAAPGAGIRTTERGYWSVAHAPDPARHYAVHRLPCADCPRYARCGCRGADRRLHPHRPRQRYL